jgi:mono/diheme cytochrome c family protein
LNKLISLELLRKTIPVLIFLGFLFSLGCDSESKPQQTKLQKTDAMDSANLQPAVRLNPVTDETRQLYQRYCTQCHGEKGHGDGINAPYLVVPPRDHTKADYLETRSDQQLFDVIKLGGLAVGRAPCMPAWRNTFEDKKIHSLVNYIRELCDCQAF